MPHREDPPERPTILPADGSRPEPAFDVLPPVAPRAPLIVHVPHASTRIPGEVRAEIRLDDAELDAELIRLTDWHTDDLFGQLSDDGATLFVNRLSRLVFDPERFLDDALEPAAARGQGVVYRRGSLGQPIRELTAEQRADRVEQLYRPYHAAFDGLVEELLATFGRCRIIDAHSFPSRPLASELDQAPDRPDICIGTDARHTPEELARALEASFMAEGFRVKRDSPFSGAFVPERRHGRDARVTSVMIEVRRGLYVDESSAERRADYPQLRAAIRRALESVLS